MCWEEVLLYRRFEGHGVGKVGLSEPANWRVTEIVKLNLECTDECAWPPGRACIADEDASLLNVWRQNMAAHGRTGHDEQAVGVLFFNSPFA